MNETAHRILRRIPVWTGIVLALGALAACGLPGYHFGGGTSPWLPGGAPSLRAARGRSEAPKPPPKPGSGGRGNTPHSISGLHSTALRSSHET